MVAGLNSTVFINEFHYDNDGTDTGEFIEIANPGQVDLTGFTVVLYNGTDGNRYASSGTFALSGAAPFVVVTLPANGLQNGAPDGIALVDAGGGVVQFLSYEGTFTASNGPAAGLTSTDVVVSETGSTPAGHSLQLQGAGATYGDFAWQAPAAATSGAANSAQTIEDGDAAGPVFINEIHYDNTGADVGEFVEVAGAAGTNLDGWRLEFYNGGNGDLYSMVPLSGTIDNEQCGHGAVVFAVTGIQNGAPDGVALIDPEGNVVQFLSYEGSFTADAGNGGIAGAVGAASSDIGIAEGEATPAGSSLQLGGTGLAYDSFTWSGPAAASAGSLNAGQTFVQPSGAGALAIADAAIAEGNDGTTVLAFTVTRTAEADGPVAASYQVRFDGSAEAADLIAPLSGTVAFAAGETSRTVEIALRGDTAFEPDETFSVVLSAPTGGATLADATATGTILDDDAAVTPIHTIQGRSHTSSFDGKPVLTAGIVTAVDSNGFYLQDPVGDGDVATSEGIFVFTSARPAVNVGESVRVSGTVDEFRPGNDEASLTITEIVTPTVAVLSSGNALPNAVVLGVDRLPPTERIEDDDFASFDPATDGIDFFESLEGMRVTVKDPIAVSPTSQFGEIFTVANNGAGATNLSERGTINIDGTGGELAVTDVEPDADYNPERIQIDDDSTLTPGSLPTVNVGARLADVTGVVSYSFGNYEVLATEAVAVEAPSTLQRETSAITRSADRLTVASYNVLNLDPNDADGDTDVADGRFELIAAQIVNALNAPDIVALQEVQDNSGSANDGTVSASATLTLLAQEIAYAGGPNYRVIDNPFIADGISGGQPGGNIRTAYLYNPERVTLVEGSVRTVPAEDTAAFADSRLPLIATFDFNGAQITTVNNHFASKGGSTSLFGSVQPSLNGSADQRLAQAQAVADFVTAEQASVDGVIVLGDLNEFEFEDSLDPIYVAGLANLMNSLPEEERYSYIFDGNSQALDQLFVTANLSDGSVLDAVHVNAEFADGVRAASDHDPLLASFLLTANAKPIAGDDLASTSRGQPVRIDVLANDTDADSEMIEVVGFGDPARGSVSVNSDGSLTYTPDADFKNGTDSFAYRIADGQGGEDMGTVTIELGRRKPLGDETVIGDNGRDRLNGGHGDDFLYGRDGDDVLRGSFGDDVLLGGGGDDDLDGGFGNDVIRGGLGRDTLAGGFGDDRFVFDDGDTGVTATTADRIAEFNRFGSGDRIDLSLIDARAGGEDNAFTYIGTAPFSGTAGELRYEYREGGTGVFGDTNGDGAADLLFFILHHAHLSTDSFVL